MKTLPALLRVSNIRSNTKPHHVRFELVDKNSGISAVEIQLSYPEWAKFVCHNAYEEHMVTYGDLSFVEKGEGDRGIYNDFKAVVNFHTVYSDGGHYVELRIQDEISGRYVLRSDIDMEKVGKLLAGNQEVEISVDWCFPELIGWQTYHIRKNVAFPENEYRLENAQKDVFLGPIRDEILKEHPTWKVSYDRDDFGNMHRKNNDNTYNVLFRCLIPPGEEVPESA